MPHLPEHGESFIWHKYMNLFILIRCINHASVLQNAYTATAINSTNFCTSARDALFILAENALRVAAINSVGDFVLFLGKVFTDLQLRFILLRIQCYFSNISILFIVFVKTFYLAFTF